MKVWEIYKGYTKYKPKPKAIVNGKRPMKRRTAKIDYTDMHKHIFNFAVQYIVLGVINSRFTFKFPNKKAYIYLSEVVNKKAYFQKYDLDPMQCGLKAYKVNLKLYHKDGERDIRIFLSKRYTNIINKNLQEGSLKVTAKEMTLLSLSKIIQKNLYPSLEYMDIYQILRYGFKICFSGLLNGIDTIVYNTKGDKLGVDRIFLKPSTDNIDRRYLVRKKIRFLYKIKAAKFSGYYYFALSHEKVNNFFKEPVYAKLFLYQEEAMLEPFKTPHIFKIKVQKTLFKIHTIYRQVTYEKNNTKYIWRWNGKGFEPTNNTKLRSY